jgi:hypothetical protein
VWARQQAEQARRLEELQVKQVDLNQKYNSLEVREVWVLRGKEVKCEGPGHDECELQGQTHMYARGCMWQVDMEGVGES